jgi:hypothetical protein
LVFNLDTTLFGRIERLNYEVRKYLQKTIIRFYGEYRRLKLMMVTNPPESLRVRLMYGLRMQELYSYVNLMTGGYLTHYARGGRPQGIDTPWFERWPNTGKEFKDKLPPVLSCGSAHASSRSAIGLVAFRLHREITNQRLLRHVTLVNCPIRA